MNDALLRQLVAATISAPSVHNVQPARWRIEGGGLILFEDRTRRLVIGDPSGNDAAISLGAAAEALRLAASLEGLETIEERVSLPPEEASLHPIARYRFAPGAAVDPLAAWLEQRASWRGAFAPPSDADRSAAEALDANDIVVIAHPAALATLARRFDRASYGFMQRGAFRNELRGWMRFKRSNPLWALDGLNAEAMALSKVEAVGAGLVLGPFFALLDKLGLAPTLLAEGSKIKGAAALILFHRPANEDPFETGRHFLRLWLAIERAGFGAGVLAALADDREAAAAIKADHHIPSEHRLVSAFRVGRRGGARYPRARLSLSTVLV